LEKELTYKKAKSIKYFFHRQLWHFLSLIILVYLTWKFANPTIQNNTWLSISSNTWFWLSVGFTIVHQVIVWIVFRLQLGWATLTKIFKSYDQYVWAIIFLPLLISRPIFIVGLANSTSNTLPISKPILIIIGIILIIPALYTLWSVLKYFKIMRALGGDHFRVSYRKMPMVDKGAFKYSGNAMYSYAFLLLYSIALFNVSQPALIVAIFQHIYIWIHYYCTEKPDMDIIYGNNE
jgi:hypothetical protein